MPGRKPIFAQPLLDFGWKPQQAKHIGDSRSIFSNAPSHFLLSHAKFGDEPFVGLSFFDWI